MILDLYSKRKKRVEMVGKTEPYEYDTMPESFRIQVIHIWHEIINKISSSYIEGLDSFYQNDAILKDIPSKIWGYINKILAKEYGRLNLSDKSNKPSEQLKNFFLSLNNIDYLLDVIECSFKSIIKSAMTLQRDISIDPTFIKEATNTINNAVKEVNVRFEEHRLGYELNNKCHIIRKDSKFIHKELVKKPLKLLDEVEFSGASDEFSKGHNQYRKGEYKEAINNANNAFESTMKTICKKKNWDYTKANGAKQLIDIMFKHELIPSHRKSHFNNLAQTLKDGLPTVRNKESGHGQGAKPIGVPRRLAQYALNLVATNIVLLVESYKDSLN